MVVPWSSCSFTHSEYQSWKCFYWGCLLQLCLRWHLTVATDHYSLLELWWRLCCSSFFRNVSVTWQWKIMSAGKSISSFSSSLLFAMYGTMMFSKLVEFHCILVRPVIWGVCDVPFWRKFVWGVTGIGLSLVHKLHRKEVTSQWCYKHRSDLTLVI